MSGPSPVSIWAKVPSKGTPFSTRLEPDSCRKKVGSGLAHSVTVAVSTTVVVVGVGNVVVMGVTPMQEQALE